MKEQPRPIHNDHEPSWEKVIRDIEAGPWAYGSLVVRDARERDEMGARKYGTRLQPHNGRDSLRDAYEESLDLIVYLANAISEDQIGADLSEIYHTSLSLCVAIRVEMLRRDGS